MPDIPEIVDLYRGLSEVHSQFHEQSRRAEELYELQFQVPTPGEDYHRHIPPTARAKLDAAIDHTITTNPTVIVVSTLAGEGAAAQSDALEAGCDGARQRLDEDRPVPLFRDAGKLALLHGLSFIKGPLWLPNPYGEKDPKRRKGESKSDYDLRVRVWHEKGKHHLPVFARAVPATDVLWQPGQWPQEYILETSLLSVSRANALYNLTLDGKDADQVLLLEYWDNDTRATLVIDSRKAGDLSYFPIRERWDGYQYAPRANPRDNIMGYIPYTPVSAGLGRASHKPEEEFQGLLTASDSSLVAEARIKTALEAITEEYAYPRAYAEDDAGNVKWGGLGSTTPVPAGYMQRYGFKPVPPTNPDLYRWLSFLLQDVQSGMGSDALQGLRAPGEVTVGQQATRIGQSSLKVLTLLNSLNAAGSKFFHNLFRLIDVMDEELPVWGVQGSERIYKVLKPGTLANFMPYLTFEPEPVEMADRRIYLAISLYQAGLLSAQTLRERFLKIRDDTEEKARILAEKAEANPLFQQALAMAGMAEAGMETGAGAAQAAGPQGAAGPVPRESDLVKQFSRMQGGAAPFGLRSRGETAGGNL